MTALAVVIVAHDSERELPRTLEAVGAQLRPEDELVIVDNASAAEPPTIPSARLLRTGANLGFAGGAVEGARATTAPLLLFLNPDAVPQPGCLDALREAPGEWAAWQALVLLPHGAGVNTSGNTAHWSGLGWASSSAGGRREVGFASGAALVVRRADWDATGGFDPAYFMYGEDLDLCLRLRLAGRRVGVVPDARVEHDYTFAKGEYKWFHLERNRWWTLLSVYPLRLLVLLAPALAALEFALLPLAWRQGWLGPKLRAEMAVLRSLPFCVRRRRRVQRTRRVSAGFFADGLTADLDSEYLEVPVAAARLQALVWACVRRLV